MANGKKAESIQSGDSDNRSANSVANPEEKSFIEELELDNRKMLASIQQYLQRGISEAREKSEVVAKQVNKQAKVFKNLTVIFALFFTYLQVRQIYVGNASSQQASKFSAWEMVQNVQGIDTSAGLAIALTTLTKSCEPLSGLNLKEKYLPELEIAFPQQDPTAGLLARIGENLFRVPSQSNCKKKTRVGDLPQHLDLRGIHFEQANLQKASFSNTDLTGAVFQDAKLQEARFRSTSGALLPLAATNFQRATLTDVDFGQADLSQANFSGADLEGAVLKNANIEGAIFTDVQNLQVNQVKGIRNWLTATYDLAFCEQIDAQMDEGGDRPQSCQVLLPTEPNTEPATEAAESTEER